MGVLGEYGFVLCDGSANAPTLPDILKNVADVGDDADLDAQTRGHAISAVAKLLAQIKGGVEDVDIPPAPEGSYDFSVGMAWVQSTDENKPPPSPFHRALLLLLNSSRSRNGS